MAITFAIVVLTCLIFLFLFGMYMFVLMVNEGSLFEDYMEIDGDRGKNGKKFPTEEGKERRGKEE